MKEPETREIFSLIVHLHTPNPAQDKNILHRNTGIPPLQQGIKAPITGHHPEAILNPRPVRITSPM
jgi:hypothetical protein